MILLRGRRLLLSSAGWESIWSKFVAFFIIVSVFHNYLDERVKDFGKVLVAVPVSSIDATVLVVKLDRASNCLDKFS